MHLASPYLRRTRQTMNALTGTACLFACVCLSFGAQMSPPGWEAPSKRSCCILLFCFPLFNCSGTQLAGEQTQRSVAGHGPVYSQHGVFLRSFVCLSAVIRVKRVSASIAVVSHSCRLLSRGLGPSFLVSAKATASLLLMQQR